MAPKVDNNPILVQTPLQSGVYDWGGPLASNNMPSIESHTVDMFDRYVPLGPGGMRILDVRLEGTDWDALSADDSKHYQARMDALRFQADYFKHGTVTDKMINRLLQGKSPEDINLQRQAWYAVNGGDLDEVLADNRIIQSPTLAAMRLEGVKSIDDIAAKLYAYVNDKDYKGPPLPEIIGNLGKENIEKLKAAYKEHSARVLSARKHLTDTGKKLFELCREEEFDLKQAQELLNGIEKEEMPSVAAEFRRQANENGHLLPTVTRELVAKLCSSPDTKDNDVLFAQKLLEHKLRDSPNLKSEGWISSLGDTARKLYNRSTQGDPAILAAELMSGFDAEHIAAKAHDALKGTFWSWRTIPEAVGWAGLAVVGGNVVFQGARDGWRGLVNGKRALVGRLLNGAGSFFGGAANAIVHPLTLGAGVVSVAGFAAHEHTSVDHDGLRAALSGLSADQVKSVKEAFIRISGETSAEVKEHWGHASAQAKKAAQKEAELDCNRDIAKLKVALIDKPDAATVKEIVNGRRSQEYYQRLITEFDTRYAPEHGTFIELAENNFGKDAEPIMQNLQGAKLHEIAALTSRCLGQFNHKLDMAVGSFNDEQIKLIASHLDVAAADIPLDVRQKWKKDLEEAAKRSNGGGSKAFELNSAVANTLDCFKTREAQLAGVLKDLSFEQLEGVTQILSSQGEKKTLEQVILEESSGASYNEIHLLLDGTARPYYPELGQDIFNPRQGMSSAQQNELVSIMRNGPDVGIWSHKLRTAQGPELEDAIVSLDTRTPSEMNRFRVAYAQISGGRSLDELKSLSEAINALVSAMQAKNSVAVTDFILSTDGATQDNFASLYARVHGRSYLDDIKSAFEQDGRTILDDLSDAGATDDVKRVMAQLLYPDALTEADQLWEALARQDKNFVKDKLASFAAPQDKEIYNVFRGLYGEIDLYL